MPEAHDTGAVKIDLTHAVNRIDDGTYVIMTANVPNVMRARACAVPGKWDERTIAAAREDATTSWWQLRWNQRQAASESMLLTRYAVDELEWDLLVDWEGLVYEHDAITYHLIENTKASCRLLGEARDLYLTASARFGTPYFYGEVAALPLWFTVRVTDNNEMPLREERRGFLIFGDGSRKRA